MATQVSRVKNLETATGLNETRYHFISWIYQDCPKEEAIQKYERFNACKIKETDTVFMVVRGE